MLVASEIHEANPPSTLMLSPADPDEGAQRKRPRMSSTNGSSLP